MDGKRDLVAELLSEAQASNAAHADEDEEEHHHHHHHDHCLLYTSLGSSPLACIPDATPRRLHTRKGGRP